MHLHAIPFHEINPVNMTPVSENVANRIFEAQEENKSYGGLSRMLVAGIISTAVLVGIGLASFSVGIGANVRERWRLWLLITRGARLPASATEEEGEPELRLLYCRAIVLLCCRSSHETESGPVLKILLFTCTQLTIWGQRLRACGRHSKVVLERLRAVGSRYGLLCAAMCMALWRVLRTKRQRAGGGGTTADVELGTPHLNGSGSNTDKGALNGASTEATEELPTVSEANSGMSPRG